MKLNELISLLQEIANEGHGEAEVVCEAEADFGYFPILNDPLVMKFDEDYEVVDEYEDGELKVCIN